jgi:glycosyltransferase involved in cell wall biosynthesis
LTKKKKILIVSECFYPEEFKINDVAFEWAKQGNIVDVLTLIPTYPKGIVFLGYKNKLCLKEEINGVNVIRLRSVVGYRGSKIKKILKYLNFTILGSVYAILNGKKYDHVFGFNLGALTDMLPAVLIKKIYKKPLTFWVQDLWPDSVYAYGFKKTKFLSLMLNSFVKFVFNNVDNFAISSNGFKSNLSKYLKNEKEISYFPNWADDLNSELSPINLSLESKINFTFAGNVGKVQNLENIMHAFSLLPKSYLDKSQLNIIGDGSNLAHLKLIANKHASIVFFGVVKRDLMAKYYKSSDFLIISLINEPIFSLTVPAKLQTYISAKKPILGIINGESSEIIKKNNLGLCAPPDDIESIVALFKECVDMSEQNRKEFIKNNNYLLNEVFNKKVIIAGLSDIVNEEY